MPFSVALRQPRIDPTGLLLSWGCSAVLVLKLMMDREVIMAEVQNRNRSDEAWIKHLEFIQNAITRMANNSFWLKGWSVTLVAATFALNITTPSSLLILIALVPVLAFWYLDAYFLHQERLFRRLYDNVCANPDRVDMSMDTRAFKNSVQTVWQIAKSDSIRAFHGSITVLVLLAAGLRLVIGLIP